LAQEQEVGTADPAEDEAAADRAENVTLADPAQDEAPATTAASEGRVDGPRFRGGIAFTGGAEFVPDSDFTATMFGLDGRLGAQINHLVGVYADLHMSFGSGDAGFGSGVTGTFAGFAMADFTFLDAVFAGAGFGYAVFNNPSGPALALRVGGYPVKSAPKDRARRKGLMLSLETRFVFLGAPYDTGYQVMGAIGYEAF
jgi:hypothetical protein